MNLTLGYITNPVWQILGSTSEIGKTVVGDAQITYHMY
jgi:hypothetical protein